MSDQPQQAPTTREAVLALVKGGASFDDACTARGVTAEERRQWLDDDGFLQEYEQARATAATLAQARMHQKAPATWIRGSSKEPMAVAVPGRPMKCSARRSNGMPCNAWAVMGMAVCRTHGGSSPQAKSAAKRRLAMHSVGSLMDRYMHAGDQDPLEALLTELARSAVMVETLAAAVIELEMEPEAGEAIYGPNHSGDAVPHVLVAMLNEERDRKARFAKMALDAGVEERRVRVAEKEAELIARVIKAVLDDPELGLAAPQRQLGYKAAARHLRLAQASGQ